MPTSPEIVMMLRDPNAGWLGTLLVALNEARADPNFNARHQELFAMLANSDTPIPETVHAAALHRSIEFEDRLDQQMTEFDHPLSTETVEQLVRCD